MTFPITPNGTLRERRHLYIWCTYDGGQHPQQTMDGFSESPKASDLSELFYSSIVKVNLLVENRPCHCISLSVSFVEERI